MKLNWGTGIFIFYTVFAGSLIFQVFQSTHYDNSLVVDNYYEEDLNYQAQYERKENAAALAEPVVVSWEAERQGILVQFPAEITDIGGTLVLYRPSTQSLDQEFQVTVDEINQMFLPTQDILPGRWSVRISWEDANKEYFSEANLYIRRL